MTSKEGLDEIFHQMDPVPIKIEGFPGGPVAKYLSAKAGVKSSIPGPGRSHMPQGN